MPVESGDTGMEEGLDRVRIPDLVRQAGGGMYDIRRPQEHPPG